MTAFVSSDWLRLQSRRVEIESALILLGNRTLSRAAFSLAEMQSAVGTLIALGSAIASVIGPYPWLSDARVPTPHRSRLVLLLSAKPKAFGKGPSEPGLSGPRFVGRLWPSAEGFRSRLCWSAGNPVTVNCDEGSVTINFQDKRANPLSLEDRRSFGANACSSN